MKTTQENRIRFYQDQFQAVLTEKEGCKFLKYTNYGHLVGVCFTGNKAKEDWILIFNTEGEFNKKAGITAENMKNRKKWFEDRRKARKEFRHVLKNGDILEASWGYEQTNVDFYEVVQVKGKLVGLREIGSRVCETTGSMSANVIPVPGKYYGEIFFRKVLMGNYVNIDNRKVRQAGIWDGKPSYSSWYH